MENTTNGTNGNPIANLRKRGGSDGGPDKSVISAKVRPETAEAFKAGVKKHGLYMADAVDVALAEFAAKHLA